MEVVVPVHEFCFDSNTTTPYASAPSSPKLSGSFNYYCSHYTTSAPTSPTLATAIYAEFSDRSQRCHKPSSSSPNIAFGIWEEKPISPKSVAAAADADGDFAFDFSSGQLEKGGRLLPELITADQLFDKGRIRPLKPPPRLQCPDGLLLPYSPRSPPSPKPKVSSSRSPRRKGERGGEVDPFTAAMMEVTRDRGRPSVYSSSRSRKGSRSLSPFRRGVEVFHSHNKDLNNSSPKTSTASTSTTTTATPPKSGAGGSKKWRLRDWLLFRSASEGRVTGNRSKDPLRKYALLSPPSSPTLSPQPLGNKRGEDSRNSSFRSTDSGGSVSRRSGAAVSPHAMHYAANRAAAEEMKKKTPLPYKQGLFSCLRFNPAVRSISRGLNSSYSFNYRRS